MPLASIKISGALWMLVAGFLFACMGVFVKLGTRDFSNIELVFYRSLIGLLVVYAIMRQRKGSISTPFWRQHLWRSLSGTIALLLFFYCITVLPLATAVTLNYTSPVFLAILLMLVLREQFHLPMVFALLTAFCGVVLLLHPTLEKNQIFPGLLGLVSGFFAAVAMINVRALGRLGEPETRTVFHFSLFATIASGGIMLKDTVHVPDSRNILILLGMGICATLAQLALTRAYSRAQALVASSLSYSAIVFASFFGILIWHETLSLDSWIGMLLIIGSGIASLHLSRK